MVTVIRNGRLLDCVGDEPLENASVVIEDGVIRDIYTGEKGSSGGAMVIDAKGNTVMPGLTDAHEHPGMSEGNLAQILNAPPLRTALLIKRNLEATLQAGFTTVRSMGGDHWYMKQAIEDGLIKGPRLLISCCLLTTTGGHADLSLFGEGLLHQDTGRLIKLGRVCDGADECRKAAREQLRAGADQIKVSGISGGCAGNAVEQAWHLQFSEAELRAIVEEAKDKGTYVGAHSFTDESTRRGVNSGVRTIEHCTFLTEETALMMKEKGAYLVPTLLLSWQMENKGLEGATPWFLKKVRNPLGERGSGSLLDGSFSSLAIARNVGVKIGSGTDCFADMLGQEGSELKLMVEAGFSPYEAIKAATMVNAEIFRMEGKIGSIEVGKWADIIIVDGHPDEDANLMSEPGNVKVVMKGGEIFKNIL